jgi:hypothetical protein
MTALGSGEGKGKVSAVAGLRRLRPQPQDARGQDLADLGETFGGGHAVGVEGVVQRRGILGGDGAKDTR